MVLDTSLREYIHDNQDSFLMDIAKLVAQPSVSARQEALESCAQLVSKMIEQAGGQSQLLRLKGAPPLVYGEVKSSKSEKTILFYNHYDVQPEEPYELWKSPPFKAEIRNGRMYGRGVSDDKGHLVARLKVIESYVKVQGGPPCNMKLCVEGEEEIGSPHLEEYVDTNPELLKSDAVMWEYGNIDAQGRPVVSLGVKGMIYLEFTIRSLSQDAPGSLAAALPNAIWRLVRMLNLIKDEDEQILIPGWYDKVQHLSDDELKILQDEPFEAQSLLSTYNAKEFVGNMPAPEAKKALVVGPTANIAGIWGGYNGPGSKTVVPSVVQCKMDFRLVPNQDPQELLKMLADYLRANGYQDVQINPMSMEYPIRTSYRNPWAQAAMAAAEETFGVKPVIEISSPGTGPLYVFNRRYGAPAVDIGFAPHDDFIHSPNENIRLDYLEKGMLWTANTIENYLASSREPPALHGLTTAP
jgi:acetylornithine deacetylase/succinyl-diaminopimelate desuccinylase-like protein